MAGFPVTVDIPLDKDGKYVSHFIVPNSSNESAWGAVEIPIAAINNGEGPKTLFIGGVHGDEYEGPAVLTKLVHCLDPKKIRGKIYIVPMLNVPALLSGQRCSPIDGKDLNRSFPGKERGTVSSILAHFITTELIPRVDAVIDLHSGGASLRFEPYASIHPSENSEQNERSLEALRAFNAPVSLVMKEFTGEGLLDYEVEKRGKIFLCAELGGARLLTPRTMRIGERGLKNLLAHFEHIPQKRVAKPKSRLMQANDLNNYHRAPREGIFEPALDLGAFVDEGQEVGQVHFIDSLEHKPIKIYSKVQGRLIGLRAQAKVRKFDCVALIAKPLH